MTKRNDDNDKEVKGRMTMREMLNEKRWQGRGIQGLESQYQERTRKKRKMKARKRRTMKRKTREKIQGRQKIEDTEKE